MVGLLFCVQEDIPNNGRRATLEVGGVIKVNASMSREESPEVSNTVLGMRVGENDNALSDNM